MTVSKRKKMTKYRGSTTHGCGSMKKRRGAGHRGGRGMAGSGKRADVKKPSVLKIKKYFGRHGFVCPNKEKIKPVNIDFLDNLVQKGKIKEGDVIKLKELGYNKLLSRGVVLVKCKIEVDYASAKAIEKIKEKGGEVKLLKGDGADKSPKEEAKEE